MSVSVCVCVCVCVSVCVCVCRCESEWRGRPGLKQNNENCEDCLTDQSIYIGYPSLPFS